MKELIKKCLLFKHILFFEIDYKIQKLNKKFQNENSQKFLSYISEFLETYNLKINKLFENHDSYNELDLQFIHYKDELEKHIKKWETFFIENPKDSNNSFYICFQKLKLDFQICMWLINTWDSKQMYITFENNDAFVLNHKLKIIKILSRSLVNRKLSFPWKKYFLLPVSEMFENLKQFIFTDRIKNDHGFPFNIYFFSKRFNLKSIFTFVSNKNDYESMDTVTDYFTEKQRLSAKRQDQTQSILESFSILESNQKLVQNTIENNSIFNVSNFREQIYQDLKECTSFKITLVITIFKHFHAKSFQIINFSNLI
jgi:hypothetical protein